MLLEEDGNYIHMKCGVALICNKWVVTSGLDFPLNKGLMGLFNRSIVSIDSFRAKVIPYD